jgi:hypothetical protein
MMLGGGDGGEVSDVRLERRWGGGVGGNIVYCNCATASYVNQWGGSFIYVRLEICKDEKLRC